MIDSFVFDAELPAPDRPVRTMCIFLPYLTVSVPQVKGILQDYLDVEGKVPPDIVLFMGTSGAKELIEKLCADELIHDCLPDITRHSCPPPVRGIVVELDGSFSPVDDASGPFAAIDCVLGIREQGLLALIRRHDIVLSGNDRFHFIKPAGTHCGSFIRGANAFVSGAGTLFAAIWLLRFIQNDTRCIYTDTAGINAFVASALLLRQQMNSGRAIPIIDSFGSYAGLKQYEFRYPDQSIFVISSSTSAGLERELTSRLHVPLNHVVTLFFLDSGSGRVPANTLCDISSQYHRRIGEFTSFSGDQCPLCRSHVPAVEIGGDQFLIDVPLPDATLLKADDTPRWLISFTKDFVGKGVLKVHRIVKSGANKPRELFIDLERILACPQEGEIDVFVNSAYRRILGRRLQTHVPTSLKHIVYIGDQGSKALAERVRSLFSETQRESISVIARTDLPRSDIRNSALATGTLLVVGGVLISGQSMMEVNQLLRDRGDDSVKYLTGMTRTRDPKRLSEILGNIQFGADGGRHYDFTSMLDIFLPDNHIERPSPWDVEAETWMRLRASILQHSGAGDVISWMGDRVEYLQQRKADGMLGGLFLPDSAGRNLELRQGFALWQGIKYDRDSYSQADVYFSVAATLHSWRTVHGISSHGERRRLLLSPRTFFRFNDGIIQASLLRACELGELDYRSSPDLSKAMVEVLSVVFAHHGDTQGEATLEFLLALLEHRLVIQKEMLSGLFVDLEEALANSDELYSRLAKTMVTKVLEDLSQTVLLTSGPPVARVKRDGRRRSRSSPSKP